MRDERSLIIKYPEARLDPFVDLYRDGPYALPKLTVGDLIADIGDRDPSRVRIEYAGCGSHTIELLDMEDNDEG